MDRDEPHSAFALVNEVLSDSDVFFANSESVFGLVRPGRRGPIRVHPSNAAGLRRSSVSIAAVANNVTIGGDDSDLTATVDALEAAGVTVVGAGSSSRRRATQRRSAGRPRLYVCASQQLSDDCATGEPS